MIEKIVNVVIKEDGFDNLNSKAVSLEDNLDNISHSNKGVASSFAESSNAVLENGGAMGLLNDLTGGYAMMVKDAVEASALFIVKKRADTVATNATTAATISANTATQSGIITKIKDVATTVTSTVAKYATATATQVVTAAQWLWNAAVVANPLVALVVAIVAAGAAIYKLTSFLLENAEANDAASKATAKMVAELKSQSMAAARGLRALKESAEYNYELAKANGASSAELRKMKEASINAEIALNKKNVTIAQATFLQERNNLAVAKANGLSDEEIAKKEKLVQAAYKEFQEQNNLLDASYKGRQKLNKDFNIEIANENKAANDKAAEQRKKDREDYLKDLAERKKAQEEAFKSRQDQYKKDGEEYLKSLEDAKAAREKLEEEQRAELEAYLEIEAEKANKAAEQRAKDKEDQLATEQAIADGKKSIQESTYSVLEKGISVLQSVAGKNKAIQKGLIVAESAIGIAKIVTSTQAANAAATLKYALLPGGAALAASERLLNNVSAGIGIGATVLSTSKALQALGGGSASSGASNPNSGGGGGTPAPPPQFNIVGQSGTNQLAQSIGARQGQPIQAYVVGNEVTSQQALDRNRINTATFN